MMASSSSHIQARWLISFCCAPSLPNTWMPTLPLQLLLSCLPSLTLNRSRFTTDCQDVIQSSQLLPSLLVPNSGCPPHSFHFMTFMTIWYLCLWPMPRITAIPHHHDSMLCLPCFSLGGPLWEVPSGRWEVVFYLVWFTLLTLHLWPWRHTQKNKTSFEDISLLSFAGLAMMWTAVLCLWLTTPTSAYPALLDGISHFLLLFLLSQSLSGYNDHWWSSVAKYILAYVSLSLVHACLTVAAPYSTKHVQIWSVHIVRIVYQG